MRVLLIAYDNDSYIPFPPLGLMYLQAALEACGHPTTIYHQDVYHYPDEDLTRLIEAWKYDIVGLGFIAGYYQYAKAKKIAAAVNACKNRRDFRFILGGHGPGAAPAYFLDLLGADCVFTGESINTIIDYINEGMDKQFKSPLSLMDPDKFPTPEYWRLPMQVYRLNRWPTSNRTDFCFPILSGSGCKWKCTFCYRADPGFRARSPESTINEMHNLWKNYGINHFQFADELFMSSQARTLEFCRDLIAVKEEGYLPANFKFDVNGRLNHATPEVLAVMKRAGCEYVNYGIESMDPVVLKNINKGLTPDRIIEGVEDTLKAGLVPGLNFMWGNMGDTPRSLDLAVDFIIKYNTGHELRTIRPVTPYPGSPLFSEAINRGLVESVEDFYENKHTNSDLVSCNFTDMDTQEMHNLLYKANIRLMRHHYEARRLQINAEAFDLYNGTNNNFRGFRDV